MQYEVSIGDKIYRVELQRTEDSGSDKDVAEVLWNIRLSEPEIGEPGAGEQASAPRDIQVSSLRVSPGVLSLIADGKSVEARVSRSVETVTIFLQGRSYECVVRDSRSLRSRKRSGVNDAGEQKVTASMPGKIVRVLARVGEEIELGQGILVIEAMKMQNEVRAPKAGNLKSIIAKQGSNVNAGEVLAVIE
ncbi:MAG TPA: biotin/lipoyl-containing protein [Terriglobales bacterium]|nr:biotin/lipoyl-containing protein [Terriglobales bacterium]